MSFPVVVGLLDSGVDPALVPAEWPRCSFLPDDAGNVLCREDGAPDRLGHGTALARIILGDTTKICISVARIFSDRMVCTPAAAAAGLDWLIRRGARIVNMSFGLTQDRAVLRDACARATAAGALLVAAAPARGRPVFPASYHGVVRVSGDARCRPGELSILGGAQADFGACVGRPGDDGGYETTGGASFAAAHFTGLAAEALSAAPGADNRDVLYLMERRSSYHGPERRGTG